ncbi:hypothetical protein [Photobacterium damselae]|uniref:hypothetical protein n=1 Tax=Photobacterium damselae TaxID=38293 RepID=UPI001EDFDFBE|nr:hypothetical protein [Photobacterium damselae]MCG3817263.1 hypothetical protein [Photobacterium damselae]
MSNTIPEPNSPDSVFELLWQKCPERIGRGSSRDVYEIDDDKVLKVCSRPSNYTNWAEIIIFNSASDIDKAHFAEVISWSHSGKFLVMERLQPLAAADIVGHKTPMCITDKKPSNFGRDNSGKIKMLDYAAFNFEAQPLFEFPSV